MTLYLYDKETKKIIITVENAVSYTGQEIVTEEGIYGPFADYVEFSSLPDCSETLRKNPPDNRTLDEIRADKLEELSASCNAAITAGMDVDTTKGTEHFSLQETDQINLTTALSAVQSGAAGYPYHADGQLCRLFTASEIQAIAAASVQHKLYHTTLCNHLLTWARRAETKEELSGITYAADGMPEDLAANMAAVLSAAAGDNNA